MKSYAHLIAKLFREPLLITPQQHAAYCQVLDARLAGGGPESRVRSRSPRNEDEEDDLPGQTGEDEDDTPQKYGPTVIIPVHGTIVRHPEDIAVSECGCSLEALNAMIDAVENNPRVERVIYDFRTPGGSVTGIPETGRKIRYSHKDTIGFFDSQCCSGGAWLAEQCRRLYGTPSSRFGSIGVYTMCLDMTRALQMDGVKVSAIFAGKYKLLGAYWKPLTKEEEAILQAQVDKIYAQFKEAMETYRVVNDEHFGNGLVFDGEEAAALGFTDGVVESLDDILDGMVE